MKYANHIGYSDVNPYEIVRVVSDKCFEVREMDAVRDESIKLEFVIGGFSSVCVNQSEQEWIISSNAENKVFKIRASKKKGWADKYGNKYAISDEPVKYYDYNF